MSWLTVSEVSDRVGIPPETVRRYITRHTLHLQVRKGHRSYQIAEGSIPVFVQIRSLYADGKQADEVESALVKSGRPTVITVNETQELVNESVNANMAESLAVLDSKMNAIMAMLMNVDERLKVEEQKQGAMDEDIKAIREKVSDVHGEVAAATERFLEIQKSQEETREQLGEIASRIETYGRRRGLFGWFKR